jgi:plasmid stabilization system protein ParE
LKPLYFGAPASSELSEAVRWYEQRRVGLGAELFDAVAAAVETIRAHPEIGAPRGEQPATRQFRVHRFPYNVVYRVGAEDIQVIAIAHASRRPGYWRNRGR